MPKDTKTLGNSKARACESLGFVHKKGCARVLTQPPSLVGLPRFELGQTEPKPVVLPLHHSPIIMCFPWKAVQRYVFPAI